MAPSFADPSDLATYLRHDVDTANAQMLLDMASAIIVDYCGWPVLSYTDTAVLDTDGAVCVMLPCLHVTGVTAVVFDGVTLDPANYSWSAMGALARHWECSATAASGSPSDFGRHRGWPPGFRRMSVSYAGGYDEPLADLTAAACSIAARAQLPLAATQALQTVGGITTNYQYRTQAQNSRLLPSEQIVLDRYALPRGR
jgi:hypothetical protein